MDDLQQLSSLLKQMNVVGNQIAKLIERPALTGHIGEFIASRIFEIELERSATSRGKDGVFRTGTLLGKAVNIKYYPKLETLDMRLDALPEYYLVLTGPRGSTTTSRGAKRPLVIDHVFLFEAGQLCATLQARGVKIQTGTSLLRSQWDGAELFPENRSGVIHLTDAQRAMLTLFGSPDA